MVTVIFGDFRHKMLNFLRKIENCVKIDNTWRILKMWTGVSSPLASVSFMDSGVFDHMEHSEYSLLCLLQVNIKSAEY